MRPAARPFTAALVATLSMLLGAATAQARTAVVVSYVPSDVWPTTIRFLRVDQDLVIKEHDQPAGYVLFEVPEGKRTHRAALELVSATDTEGRPATQLVLSIPDLPRRFEVTLLDKLAAKLRDERGAPPAPRKPPASSERAPEPPARPDAGTLPRPPTWGPPAR